MLIALPNLSAGNFASVLRMVEKSGGSAKLIDDPSDLRKADKIILAGVGAFDNGMASLANGGWIEPLTEAVHGRRVPLLGICLGMQLLCRRSEEGQTPGLGWLDADVCHFRPTDDSIKVPHMGWNTVNVHRPWPLFENEVEEQRYYFVHSYYVKCDQRSDVVATCRHDIEFDAIVSRGHSHGVQFHPEKSHRFGLAIMRKFVEL
jgi:glutamine amidotransferase